MVEKWFWISSMVLCNLDLYDSISFGEVASCPIS